MPWTTIELCHLSSKELKDYLSYVDIAQCEITELVFLIYTFYTT